MEETTFRITIATILKGFYPNGWFTPSNVGAKNKQISPNDGDETWEIFAKDYEPINCSITYLGEIAKITVVSEGDKWTKAFFLVPADDIREINLS